MKYLFLLLGCVLIGGIAYSQSPVIRSMVFTGTVTSTNFTSSADSSTAAGLVVGSGANTTNFLSLSGGRALIGYDASGGAIAVEAGSGKGFEVIVNGSTFGTGTLGLNMTSTGIATFSSTVKVGAVAFASLPSCVSGLEGTMSAVTDSTTIVFAATITGGGANHTLAYCNGTNWTVR